MITHPPDDFDAWDYDVGLGKINNDVFSCSEKSFLLFLFNVIHKSLQGVMCWK
jgi:hypothetical protein